MVRAATLLAVAGLIALLGAPAAPQVGGELAPLERAVADHPLDIESRLRLAEAYAARGFIEEAAAAYCSVLVRDRENSQARIGLRQVVATRMPRWLPAVAAELAPFPRATLSMQVATRPGELSPRRFLRTTGSFAAEEGERRDRLYGWSFPWVEYGYVWESPRWVARFRVHRGEGVGEGLAGQALVALMYFHQVVRERLDLDPTRPDTEPVHLWITTEGKAGGQALGRHIYLTGVGVARTPAEWLREVAHEYGHLVLPGIGGFRETADPWADGFLGELLFVKWLAEGGQPEGLAWSVLEAERAAAARRRSLMARARGPFSRVRLAGAGEQAQDYFLGLALWVEAAWGPRLLGEALARCPRGTAADFVAAAERLQRERGLLRPWAPPEVAPEPAR